MKEKEMKLILKKKGNILELDFEKHEKLKNDKFKNHQKKLANIIFG